MSRVPGKIVPILSGLIAALIYWLLDAFLDTFVFYNFEFVRGLIPDTHEMLMRLEAAGILLILTTLLVRYFRKQAALLKQLEEARRRAEMERAHFIEADRQRYLVDMAANMAHEINQPLSGVRSLTEHVLLGLERGWNLESEKVQKNLSRVIEEVDRMSALIDHVRNLSAHKDLSEKTRTDLNTVLESTLAICRTRLQSRGVQVISALTPGLPTVFANPFALEQAMFNLIGNAESALDEKFAHIDPTIELPQITVTTALDSTSNPVRVILTIEDNGVGMDDTVLQNAFIPFFSTRRPGRGTGVGLSVSRAIVEDLGGTLALTSSVGKGTVVSVSFPVSASVLPGRSHD